MLIYLFTIARKESNETVCAKIICQKYQSISIFDIQPSHSSLPLLAIQLRSMCHSDSLQSPSYPGPSASAHLFESFCIFPLGSAQATLLLPHPLNFNHEKFTSKLLSLDSLYETHICNNIRHQ